MTTQAQSQPRRNTLALQVAVFALLAVAGLLYVKWLPYYNRAFTAAANHSIGNSILMGKDAHPPAASWSAASSCRKPATRP